MASAESSSSPSEDDRADYREGEGQLVEEEDEEMPTYTDSLASRSPYGIPPSPHPWLPSMRL